MKSNSHLIFIVDDDPDDRQIILDAFLERSPLIDYVFIENAEMLMETLYSGDAEFPALILLDLNMPGMLGLQALKEIRGNKQFSQIPVIVLTTSTLNQDRKTSYELGASCFLRKPDSFSELVELTDSIVKLWLHEYQPQSQQTPSEKM
ncbi:MAG TPA: response regulator [Puia sp.]|jgi:CheY-like chemotaxis protein|nr:response regulator [Puia sp.]